MYWFSIVLVVLNNSVGDALCEQAGEESLSGNSKMSKSRIHAALENHIYHLGKIIVQNIKHHIFKHK